MHEFNPVETLNKNYPEAKGGNLIVEFANLLYAMRTCKRAYINPEAFWEIL